MTTTSNAQRAVTALLGTKLGMTQVWDEAGRIVPVTAVQVDTNVVTQVRNADRDGYEAVQLAFGAVDPRRVTKPLVGHFEAAGVTPRRHVAEVRTSNAADYSLVLGIATISIISVSVAVFLIDIIYPLIDPRVQVNS